MLSLRLILALTLAGTLLLGFQPSFAQEDRKQQQTQVVEELLGPDKNWEVRHFGNVVSGSLDAGVDMDMVGRLLRKTFSFQVMDSASPHFGWFQWRTGDGRITDPNSLEFTMMNMAAGLNTHWSRLPDDLKTDILPNIRAALVAFRNRKVPPGYTNIYLMNAVSSVLLGEMVDDKEAVDFGYGELGKWIEFTRASGITEYVTPNYYAVSMRPLYMGYRLTRLPEVRARLQAIMDYFWADVCANYLPANATISGAYSRTYEFLPAQIIRDSYCRDEGLLTTDPAERRKLREAALKSGGYHPSEKIYELAFVPEKVVVQRTDAHPRGRRYNYITPDFSISSISRDHENIDRPIAIEFASGKNLPTITVQPEPFDEPYGLIHRKKDGRVYHFFLHPTIVQEKGAMLALVDLDTNQINQQMEAPLGVVSTDVVLPAKADAITLDGKRFDAGAPFRQIAGDRSVVGVREGKTGVAIRIFRADTCEKQRPVYVLQADERGLGVGALRYTVYSYRGPERKLTEGHIRVGLLFLAEKCTTDEDFQALVEKARMATFTEQTKDNLWEVAARVGDLVFEVGHDLGRRWPVYRRVNGREVSNPRLMVNGVDMGPMLLDSVQTK